MFLCLHGVVALVMIFVPCLIFTDDQVTGFFFSFLDVNCLFMCGIHFGAVQTGEN